jgi:excinuclease UvrABC nuclease subunit
MPDELLTVEALAILQHLTDQPFEECFALEKKVAALPRQAGIYAIRHREIGILYIGKSLNIRKRFMDGHKALYSCYVDRIDPVDIRIAVYLIADEQRRRMLNLEARIIQITKPSYNSVIRKGEG